MTGDMSQPAGGATAGVAERSGGDVPHVRIAIVGSGFAGLGMAIRLKQAGVDDFVVLERAGDVGGTWRDNSYPGCQCDVPSHLYSFSFAPNPRWSRTFSRQPEIWEYLRRCAREQGVLPHLRFHTELRAARWDDDSQRWTLETSTGPLTAQVLVSGTGALSDPAIPAIPGLDRFQGAVFHSAQWRHDHDLTGRRVAVIGTGASSIQFVPRIQPQVAQLTVFQRTPPWIMPHPDRRLSDAERRLYAALPAAQRAMRGGIYWARETYVFAFLHEGLMQRGERVARRHLERQVPDPVLRAKLQPTYRMGCKRILLSDDYYPALTQPNVDVVTDRISEVRENGVVTGDGVLHECDTIIFGTGFHVTDMPVAERIHGRDGASLADRWQGSPSAYLGTTVSGFPNLFLFTGPNTGLGHSSMVFMIESQIAYIMDCLRLMQERRLGAVEVREGAQEAYNRSVQESMRGTVWTSGCASWYLDRQGRNRTLWPGFTWSYRRRTRRFDAAAYLLRPAVRARSAAAA